MNGRQRGWAFCVGLLMGILTTVGAAENRRALSVALRVYEPRESTALSTYGTGIQPFLTYEGGTTDYADLRLGAGFLRQSGDAYASGPSYFLNGPRAYQTVAPLEASVCGRVPIPPISLNPFRRPRMFFLVGVGVQYLFFREKLPERPLARGHGIGTVFFLGPEFVVGKRLRVGAELHFLRSRLNARSQDAGDYDVDLDATLVQIAVRHLL